MKFAVLLGLKDSFLVSSFCLVAILIGSGLYSGNLPMVLLYPFLAGFEGLKGASLILGGGATVCGLFSGKGLAVP